MKILYVITRSNWGGAQAHLLEVLRSQVKYGNDISLIVGEYGELTERVVKQVPKVKIQVVTSLVRDISPINDFRTFLIIRDILKKEKPDIIHMHSSKAGVLGRLAALNTGVYTVFTAHGWSFTNGVRLSKRIIYQIIEMIMSKMTDKIICVSEYDRQLALKTLPVNKSKIMTIYNGVESPTIFHATQKSYQIADVLKLVMVARFDLQKNQIALIKAIEKRMVDDVSVTFVGSGPEEEKCKEIVKNLSKKSRFKFLGYQDNVEKVLKKNDAFILTTNYEGLPISILEAMRLGMPILASNVGGISEEVIDHVNGCLFNNNVDEINHAINEVKNNVRNYGGKSVELIKQKFLLSDCLSNINDVYEVAMRDKRRQSR